MAKRNENEGDAPDWETYPGPWRRCLTEIEKLRAVVDAVIGEGWTAAERAASFRRIVDEECPEDRREQAYVARIADALEALAEEEE